MELLQNLVKTAATSTKEVDDSITTLVDRLSHSTLISDRRGAILSLKSFSRQYREIVVAKGLKHLVANLHRDSMDPDIVKATLETLLILFIRGEGDQDFTRDWISEQSRVKNGKYPSPTLLGNKVKADQFSLWIADELTQSVENIELLIDFLESDDLHIRIYALQLLQALCTTRPTRTRELILKSPTAVSRLCVTLDEVYEPIRNEAILLLMSVAKDNFNIQKLVVFENTFDKLYQIITEEGGIEGNIIVQDCLSLIGNLLSFNSVNQKYFLETNCMPNLAQLIRQPLTHSVSRPIVWNEQRLQNLATALDTCRLFVPEGAEQIQDKQRAMVDSNIMLSTLQLAFSLNTPNQIRVNALLTVADIIRGSEDVQAQFAQIDVPYLDPSLPPSAQKYGELIPVIIALLDWCLYVNSVHLFDLRAAASVVLKAYFCGNNTAKMVFLKDQAVGFREMNGLPAVPDEGNTAEVDEKETKEIKEYEDASYEQDKPNEEAVETLNAVSKASDDIVTSLESEDLQDGNTNGHVKDEGFSESSSNGIPTSESTSTGSAPQGNILQALVYADERAKLNPYKIWFSADLLMYLFSEFEAGKIMAMKITIGDGDADEDVISIIDAISQALCSCLKFSDPRVAIGYLMLLICWVWEDYDAVDMFLKDASSLDQLLAYLVDSSQENYMVPGLVATFLGSVYEFTRKESPISRQRLFSILNSRIGANSFSLKVQQFMNLPQVKQFSPSEDSQRRDETGLPQVFFGSIFISMVKENYPRIRSSFGKNAEVEPVRKLDYSAYEEVQNEYESVLQQYATFKKEATFLEKKQTAQNHKLTGDYEELCAAHKEMEERMIKLREANGDLNAKLSSSLQEVAQLKEVQRQLEAEATELQKNLHETKTQMDKFMTEHERLKDQFSSVSQQKASAENGINKMSRELMNLTKEKGNHEEIIKALTNDVKVSSNKIASMEKKLEDVLTQKNETIASLQRKINAIQSERETSNTNYNALSESLQENGERLRLSEEKSREYLAKIRQAAELIQTLKDQKASSNKEREELKEHTDQELNSLKEQVVKLSKENKEISDENGVLSKKLDSLQDELTSAFNDFTSLQAESGRDIDELNNSVEQLTDNLKAAEHRNKELEEQIKELKVTQKEMMTAKDERTQKLKEKYEGSIKELQTKNTDVDKRFKLKLEDYKKLEAAKENAEKSLGTLSSSFEEQRSQLESKLLDVTKELEKSILKIKSLESEHEKVSGSKDEQVKKLWTEVANVSKQLENSKAHNVSIEDKLKSSKINDQANVAALEKKILAVNSERENLKTELDDANTSLREKDLINSKIQEKYDLLEREKKTQESDLARITLEKESIGKEMTDLKDAKLSEMMKLEANISDLDIALRQSKKDEKDLSSRLEMLTKSKKEAEEKASQSSTKLLSATSSLEHWKLDNEELRSKLSSKESKLGVVENKLASMSSLLEENQKQKDILEKDINSQKSDKKSAILVLEKKLKEYEAQNELLKKNLGEIDESSSKKITEMEAQVKSLVASVSKTNKEKDSLQTANAAEMERLNAELKEKAFNCARLESEKSELTLDKENQVENLLRQLEDNKLQMSDVKSDLTELKVRYSREVDKLKQEKTSISKSENGKTEMIEKLRIQTEQGSKDLKNALLAQEQAEKNIVDKEGSIARLKENIDNLSTELVKTKENGTEIAQAKNKAETKLKEDLTAYQGKIRLLNTELEDKVIALKNMEEAGRLQAASELEKENELSDLLKKSQEEQTSNNNFKEEITGLKTELKQVTSDRDKLREQETELRQSCKESRTLLNEKKQLNEKMKTLSESNVNGTARINELVKNVSELEQTIKSLSDGVTSKEKTITTLLTQSSDLQNKLDESEKATLQKGLELKKLNGTLLGSKEQISVLNSQMEDLKISKEAGSRSNEIVQQKLKGENERLEKSAKEKSKEIEKYRSELDKSGVIREEHGKLIEENKTLKEKLSKNSSSISKHVSQKESLKELIKKLRTEIVAKTKAISEADFKRKEAEQSSEQSGGRVEELASRLTEVEKSKSELMSKFETKAKKHEEVQKQKEKETVTKVEELKSIIKGLEAQLVLNEREKSEAQTEIGQLRKSVEDTSEKKASQELDDMKLIMLELDDENDKLKRKLKDLGEEISEDDDSEDDESDDVESKDEESEDRKGEGEDN
ncbi:hypothetical protein FOA43_000751 [Brettanomyces nanus]|uniref:Vesicle tethering protein Uso1/P115-like head domain-containing protein n=1 Tax=Eeniella nana TaxID=13502 RepID=A0A875RW82_EENNA|nr:uncharacterized protein FOA43_000751 [Brettanomyces nanus]QPG73441.1 hypothetical protein FOA43_000751 [Brettanomyces nanus]